MGRKDLNGKKGTVMSWMEDKGRYNVKCEEGGEVVAIRPINLMEIEYTKTTTREVTEAERLVSDSLVSAQRLIGATIRPCPSKPRSWLAPSPASPQMRPSSSPA